MVPAGRSAAIGDVFASPTAEQMAEAMRLADGGAGVVRLYGNYGGDVMNFDMAGETVEMEMGMGIHGEPGVWRGKLKMADDIAREMLDLLTEDMSLDALDAVRESLAQLDDPADMLCKAGAAVRGVMDEYRQRPCRQGRARIFGDRTVGLDDPGMAVIQRLVEGLGEASRLHGP